MKNRENRINKNKVTKDDIVRKIADETGLTQNEAKEVIQKLFDKMTDILVKGEKIEFRNFGVFELKVAKTKKARNPKKPQNEVMIPEHVVVKFKPGLSLKKQVLKIKSKNVGLKS